MGQNGSKITAQDKAILDLKMQRDKLKQYQKRIQVVLDREATVAKQCIAKGDKQRALLALRKRKYQEQLLSKTDTQLETLEQLTSSIEFALVQKDIMYGLEQGNKVLKTLNSEMSIDKVERILDESAEGVAYQEEISNMLATNISNSDELEVQEEFERLRLEVSGDKEGPAVEIPHLPNVPDKVPQSDVKHAEGAEEEAEKETRQPVLA